MDSITKQYPTSGPLLSSHSEELETCSSTWIFYNSCLRIHHHTKGFDSLLTFHLWVVATFTTLICPPFVALVQAKLQDVQDFSTKAIPILWTWGCALSSRKPQFPRSHLSFPPSILFLIYECQWGIRMTRGSQGPFVKVGALIVHTYSPPPQIPPHNSKKTKIKLG